MECVARGLDPMTTNLVVADPTRSENTICLAVSPSMKALGVKNRCRIKDIPGNIKHIVAQPRMQLYIDCAAEIYAVFLKYIAPEDIHVYSIDESFLDVTPYLAMYKMTAKEIAVMIIKDVKDTVGTICTCGIGTNLYLAKIALDIKAKHAIDFIGVLDEESYRAELWDHKPITDFWQIAEGKATRLRNHGIATMREVAMMDEAYLYDWFGIDAELFVKEKCAIFLILPEEDATKNFVASLMIQNLARELFSVANEHGGKLPNRAVFFCDELGTMPPFDILPLFSAGRSRRLTLVPIIQSLAQLEKNYGKEGSEIMCDNCQDTIFGGFAPNSQTANTLSGNLGSRTVLSGTVTKGKNDDSQSLQMMERPLMSPDELKSMPKGSFVVMKTGTHPMKTKLKLFFEWGIQFQKPLEMPDRGSRPVYYAGKQDLERSILSQFPMIHMPMGATMPSRVQQASKPMPENTSIKTSTE